MFHSGTSAFALLYERCEHIINHVPSFHTAVHVSQQKRRLKLPFLSSENTQTKGMEQPSPTFSKSLKLRGCKGTEFDGLQLSLYESIIFKAKERRLSDFSPVEHLLTSENEESTRRKHSTRSRSSAGTNPTDPKHASFKSRIQVSLKSQPVFCAIKNIPTFSPFQFWGWNAHRALPVWMWPDFLAEHMWTYRKHFHLAQLPLSISYFCLLFHF